MLVEILLSFWIGIILIVSVFIKRFLIEFKVINYMYFLTLCFLFIFSYFLIKSIESDILIKLFYGLIQLNSFIQFIKLISICLVIMVIVMSIDYLKIKFLYSLEYLALILFILLAVLMLVSSEDLIIIYMLLELQGLSLYILAAYNVVQIRSSEAGLKYFIIGSLASIMYLFGVLFIYYKLGSVDLGILKVLIYLGIEDFWIEIGVFLIISGLLFKLAVAPFHIWIADVYEGVLLTVMAFYAIVPKITLVVIIIKLMLVFGGEFFLVYMAFLCIVIGTLAALYQVNLKRLIAYSAVAHMGFIVLGLVIGGVLSFSYIILYMLIYALISINLFSIIIGLDLENIRELNGMFRSNVVLMFIAIFNFFSLVGVPPLSGFYGKAFLLLSAIESNFYYLAIIFVIFSVISAFYYLRLVKIVLYEEKEEWVFFKVISKKVSLLISFTFCLNIMFIFFVNDLLIIIIKLLI